VVRLHRRADEEARQRDHREAEALRQVLVDEGVAVVVLGEDVEEAAVDDGLDVVEFPHEAVLDPVDGDLAAEHEQKGAEHLTAPAGDDPEAVRDDGGAQRDGGVEGGGGAVDELWGADDGESADFDDVA